MEVGVVQLTSNDSVEGSWQQIQAICQQVSLESIDLICLPENSLYMRMQEADRFSGLTLQDHIWDQVKDFAREHRVGLMFGALPLRLDKSIFNSTVFVSSQGVISHLYDKIHLFDIELEGKKPVRESDYFTLGDVPRLFEFQGWSFGCSICYDLRFGELYRFYREKGADILLIPSAFLVPTGKAHWEGLLRARAIENQCYVIAAAQGGEHISSKDKNIKRKTYGHSMVVDPWGKMQQLDHDRPGIFVYDLDKSELEKARRQMPMEQHRRSRKWNRWGDFNED